MACRVLLLTPQTPYPPDQGAPIRNYSFVRYLGMNPDYELSLLSFARTGEDPLASPALDNLRQFCRTVALVPHPPRRSKARRALDMALDGRPDLALRLRSAAFQAALNILLARQPFDAILCEALEMAPFVLSRFGNRPAAGRPRLVLDEHNAEYLLQRRIYENDRLAGLRRLPAAIYSRLQARRLTAYEAGALAIFDRAIAVSEPDRQALLALPAVNNKIEVLPNGIDLEEFSPGPAGEEEPDTLVFTGTMDFRPNVDAVSWFGREVWPLVRDARPAARFFIVGRRPTPAVQALAGLPGVVVTGEVEDARPYIRRSSLYVVPMRMGGGVRYKVLEALAMGKALVTTPMGADGIDLATGRDALLAESADQFARTILTLLADPARRAELGRQGRRFVEQRFDWRKITPRLDQVLQ